MISRLVKCVCVGRHAVLTVSLVCAITLSSAQKPAPALQPAAQQLHQALDMVEHGSRQKALELTNQLLEQHPNFAPALKLKGMLLEDAGQREEAAEFYQKGLQLAPNDADLLYKVGIYQLVAGDKMQAISLLLHYLRIVPNDGDANYYLAQAYHLTGRDDLALKAIQQCMKYEPENPSVMQKYGELLCSSGDSETGINWLLKAQKADSNLARIDLDLGIASLNNMDLQNAEMYSRRAVRIQPDDADALGVLASAESKLSKWQDATVVYEQILALKKDDPDAMLGLGHCELELKSYQNAIDTLNQLLNIDPSRILAHYYLSRAYARLGNEAEAQHQADLHHKMMEQMSFSASALGTEEDKAVWDQARQLLTGHREDAALKLFKNSAKGLSETPGHPNFLIGALYLYMGDTANGLRNLHRALEIEPKVRGAHTFLGIYDLQQGKIDDAEKEFSAEIKNDPNYQTAVAELGVVRYKQGRWAEAADQLSKSHTRNPALLIMLCDAYYHCGKVKEADLTAEIAAAYSRDDQQLMDSLIELMHQNGRTDVVRRLTGVQRP